MKKASLYILAGSLVSFIGILACNKAYNDIAAGTPQPSVNQLFSAFRYTPQTISVTAGRDTVVFGNNGTMIHFYANSFQDASGNPVRGGAITLQLVEMYKPADFVSNRATTMADKQLLQSGGQISIVATMNGKTVYANKYGVGFPQASPVQQTMSLFAGNTNNGDSVTNWKAPDTAKQGTVAVFSTTNAYGRPFVGYVFDSSSSIQYTNCDAFYQSDSVKTTVSVIVPDTSFNPNTTEVFLILPSINCAMSTIEPELGGANWNAATKTISLVSESQTAIVPAGMNYKLVVIANKNGKYYYYTQTGTIPHTGLVANAAMAPQSQSFVKTQLAAL